MEPKWKSYKVSLQMQEIHVKNPAIPYFYLPKGLLEFMYHVKPLWDLIVYGQG